MKSATPGISTEPSRWERARTFLADLFGKVTVRVLSGLIVAYFLGWISNSYIPPLLGHGSANVVVTKYAIRFLPNAGTNISTGRGDPRTPHAVNATMVVRNESDVLARDCRMTWDSGWWYYSLPGSKRGDPTAPFSLLPRGERTLSFVASTAGTPVEFASSKGKAHLSIECANSPKNTYVPEQ